MDFNLIVAKKIYYIVTDELQKLQKIHATMYVLCNN
jgi:hypothetical protein